MIPPHLIDRLRNLPVRKIIRALEADGFIYRRKKGAGRLYRHPDGRRAVVHYHHSGDTLPIGTLRNILEATRWTEEEMRTLQLL